MKLLKILAVASNDIMFNYGNRSFKFTTMASKLMRIFKELNVLLITSILSLQISLGST